MRAYKIVAEAYPIVDGPHFSKYACAGVAFFVSWNERDSARSIAQRYLWEHGWTGARYISGRATHLQTMSKTSANEARIVESIERGRHVCNLHRVKSLIVGSESIDNKVSLFKRFAWLGRRGLFVLVTGNERLATASIDEQDVVPIWTREKDALAWASDWWTRVRVRKLDPSQLASKVSRLSELKLLAVALTSESLCTVHPAALIDAIGTVGRASAGLPRKPASSTQKRRTKLKEQHSKA